jgi:hypothetical protein
MNIILSLLVFLLCGLLIWKCTTNTFLMFRTVVFSSEGLVGSTLSSYLGRYYFTLVDETGRIVYQHEKGDTFLHYIDDPPHRYAVRFSVTGLKHRNLSFNKTFGLSIIQKSMQSLSTEAKFMEEIQFSSLLFPVTSTA